MLQIRKFRNSYVSLKPEKNKFEYTSVMGTTLKKASRFILNKYVIVFVGFLAFVLFFDNHNLVLRWKTQRKLETLEKELDFFQNEIKTNKAKIKRLQTDNEYLEKFAREEYMMKEKDEEIFIIKD